MPKTLAVAFSVLSAVLPLVFASKATAADETGFVVEDVTPRSLGALASFSSGASLSRRSRPISWLSSRPRPRGRVRPRSRFLRATRLCAPP